ncbi:MAG: PD40 domain-containing protein [Candidatus Solibacter usitatus]|nr:PD40 domain-containing protein [Candidatus Solibacter usitatus]
MSSRIPQPASEDPQLSPNGRLESWKEIAAYLRRDLRTVQRWEKQEALPVHRHLHNKLGTVYAFKHELEAWSNNRQPQAKLPAHSHRAWHWAVLVALAGTAVALVWRLGTHPPSGAGILTRRVWSGPDTDRLGSPSPDGRYLAFVDPSTLDLAIRNLETGQQRRLTNRTDGARAGQAYWPVISPDGRHVAFSWNHHSFFDLRVIDSGGSNERVLYRSADAAVVRATGWSPDGSQILAVVRGADGAHRIEAIAAAGGGARVLRKLSWREPWMASFSPDGRYIAYDLPHTAGHRSIFLLSASNAATGQDVRLLEHAGSDLLLGWAAGNRILYSCDRTGTWDAWMIPVADGKAAGEPVLIKKDLGSVWPLGLTRNGTFFYGIRTAVTDVYIAGLDVPAGVLLAPPASATLSFAGVNEYPDWSPDGRYLAYAVRRTARDPAPDTRIVIRPVQGGEPREMFLNLEVFGMIRWSPDGRSLLVSGADAENRNGLFRADVETGRVTRVVERADAAALFYESAWAPDGGTIYYKLKDGYVEPARLLIRNLRTGQEKDLLPSVYRFDLSPDGKRLAYATFDQTADHLAVLPAGGGPPRVIYHQPRGSGRIVSIAWTPDGRYLLFSRRGELWRIPAEGGPAMRLPLSMESLRQVRVHPDGRRVAFTAGSGKGEVWILESFLPHI